MEPVNKKQYNAPTVTKVRLVVSESVLATCHVSPTRDPQSPLGGCTVTYNCFAPARP